jgi:hypothetical protein
LRSAVSVVGSFRGLVADEVNFGLGWLGWSWGRDGDGLGGIGLLEQNVDQGLLFGCWGQLWDIGLFVLLLWGTDEEDLVVLLWDLRGLGGTVPWGLWLFWSNVNVDVLVDSLLLGSA